MSEMKHRWNGKYRFTTGPLLHLACVGAMTAGSTLAPHETLARRGFLVISMSPRFCLVAAGVGLFAAASIGLNEWIKSRQPFMSV